MKICILTPRYPFPENGGDVLRINNIARYLKEKGHYLILISFYDKNSNLHDKSIYDKVVLVKHNKILSSLNSFICLLLGKPLQIGYYFSFKYLYIFKKVLMNDKPDLFISHLLRMVPYLGINNLLNNSIIEMTDVLSKTYSISNEVKGYSIKKFIYGIEYSLIRKYEQKVTKKYKKIVLVSEDDKKYLSNNSNVHVFSNGINLYTRNKYRINHNKIIFIGNMRTLQNIDSVMYFYKDILPLIKKKIPDLQFYIIGAQTPQIIQKLHNGKDIIVTGFVESMEDYISDAMFTVAPIRIAAGIQNKVLSSMACGVPVILSSLVAKGIPELENKKNCFISDNNYEFAEIAIMLSNNIELRNEIAENAYKTVKKSYDWFTKLEGYELL